jgi:DNA-binding transcriptional LysR family regulator
MPAVIRRLAETHPKIILHVTDARPAAGDFQLLRERRLDLMIAPWGHARTDDDLQVETLLEESFTVVAGAQSPWAQRKKVDLGELMDEPWICGEPGNAIQMRISEAIRARCGRLPSVGVCTIAMSLRLALLASGNYISCIASSVYRNGAQGRPIQSLPIDLGLKLPIAMITLKQRTLSPAAQVFIDCARQVAQEMAREA